LTSRLTYKGGDTLRYKTSILKKALINSARLGCAYAFVGFEDKKYSIDDNAAQFVQNPVNIV
jgi:hypothetical protein